MQRVSAAPGGDRLVLCSDAFGDDSTPTKDVTMTTPKVALSISFTLSVAAAVGCGKPANAPGGSADQVAAGAALYADDCAKCHGALGQGTDKAPPLVGAKALPLEPPPGAKVRTTPFHTAKDVLDFIRVNMPLDRPGSLSE